MDGAVLFKNGCTAYFRDGEQVGELQKSWFMLYVEFLVANGIDPTKVEFELPDGKYQVFRTEDGWNYQAWKALWPGAPNPAVKEQRADLLTHIATLTAERDALREALEEGIQDCRYHDEYGKGKGLYLMVTPCDECRYWEREKLCAMRAALAQSERGTDAPALRND